jgi:hypothetical protein
MRMIPTMALQFLHVFGPRQALANLSTGILTLLASHALPGA